MEKKLEKLYLTFYSLLTAQDLLQAHYQISLVINLKNFIKLNVGHDDKKYETCGIKCKYCNCFFEYTNFDLIE